MNFLATEVRAAGPRWRHRHLAGRTRHPRSRRRRQPRPGDKATLGVRPGASDARGRRRARRRGHRRRAPRRRDLSLHPRGGTSRWSSLRPTATTRPACMIRSRVGIEPETCHLFDAEGRALPHLARHPLAEMRPAAPQAQPAQQAQPLDKQGNHCVSGEISARRPRRRRHRRRRGPSGFACVAGPGRGRGAKVVIADRDARPWRPRARPR